MWAAPILLVDEVLKAVGRYLATQNKLAAVQAKKAGNN